MDRFLIFDMDGVLVNSEPFHKEVLAEVFRLNNLQLKEVYYNGLVGMSNRAIWEKVQRDFEIPQAVSALREFHLRVFFDMLEGRHIPQPPGLSALITRLKELGVKCSLASSSPMRLIDEFVHRLQIGSLLDHKVSGEHLERSKPFPDIFLKVSENYGQHPGKFWVIEDSAHGVQAAIAAGMQCIGYRNPDSGNQDLSSAHLEIDHFDELNETVLKGLWK